MLTCLFVIEFIHLNTFIDSYYILKFALFCIIYHIAGPSNEYDFMPCMTDLQT